LTAGLAGATETRSLPNGISRPSASATSTSFESHIASASGPSSTTGIRSWIGAQISFASVVRIATPVPSYTPAKANGPPSSTV
jgi:hypothetical protein